MSTSHETADALDALDALEASAAKSLEIASKPLPSGQPVPLPPLVEAAIGPNLKKFFGSKTNAV